MAHGATYEPGETSSETGLQQETPPGDPRRNDAAPLPHPPLPPRPGVISKSPDAEAMKSAPCRTRHHCPLSGMSLACKQLPEGGSICGSQSPKRSTNQPDNPIDLPSPPGRCARLVSSRNADVHPAPSNRTNSTRSEEILVQRWAVASDSGRAGSSTSLTPCRS